MGGRYSQGYATFQLLAVKAFLALRPYTDQLVSTVQLMLDTGLPSFKGEPTIKRLRDRFAPGLNERQAAEWMMGIAKNAHENVRSTVYDEFQRVSSNRNVSLPNLTSPTTDAKWYTHILFYVVHDVHHVLQVYPTSRKFIPCNLFLYHHDYQRLELFNSNRTCQIIWGRCRRLRLATLQLKCDFRVKTNQPFSLHSGTAVSNVARCCRNPSFLEWLSQIYFCPGSTAVYINTYVRAGYFVCIDSFLRFCDQQRSSL